MEVCGCAFAMQMQVPVDVVATALVLGPDGVRTIEFFAIADDGDTTRSVEHPNTVAAFESLLRSLNAQPIEPTRRDQDGDAVPAAQTTAPEDDNEEAGRIDARRTFEGFLRPKAQFATY